MRPATRRWLAVLTVLTVTLLAGCTLSLQSEHSTGGETLTGTVDHVVDGDTIDVRLENGTVERVRLLGVDTPEVHVDTQPGEYEGVPDTEVGRSCLRRAGENASDRVAGWIEGERVTLRLDPSADTRGGYGRLLAIAVHDNESVNYALVQEGHARLYDTDFSERDRYADAEGAAMAADRGLWRCRAAE